MNPHAASDGPGAQAIDRRWFLLVLGIACFAGVVERFVWPGSIDFPLGEGGLFVLFSEQILAHGFGLPERIQWNGLSMPMGYPPAGFYLAAAVAKLTGLDLLTVYHVVPRSLNLLAVPAFCLFAARLTRDRVVFACASLLYALMPESVMWQITGGGLPRALGALCALLALALACPGQRGRDRPSQIGAGLLVGPAILSHLEWGLFAAFGVTLVSLARRPFRGAVNATALIGSVALLVVLPWLLLILSRHGLAPFLSSASGSSWSLGDFSRRLLTGNVFASTLTLPALLGVYRLIRLRDGVLIAWAPLILLTTPRMGMSSGLAIPTALLAGYGLREAGDMLAGLLSDPRNQQWRRRLPNFVETIAGFQPLTLVLFLFFAATLLTNTQWMFMSREMIRPVERSERDFMKLVGARSDPGDRFVLVTDAGAWFLDRIAEWFPYLAGRESVTTAQGLEWAGPGAFTDRLATIERFKVAQVVDPTLFPAYVHRVHCHANMVAMFVPASAPERRAFRNSAAFELLFQSKEHALFRRRAPVCVDAPPPGVEREA